MRHGSAIGAKTSILAIASALLLAGPALSAATPSAVSVLPTKTADAKTRYDALIASAQAAMMAEPDKALNQARAAGRLAASTSGERARALASARSAWLEGEALSRLNRPEDARPLLAGALTAVIRHDRGGKLHGDLLRSSAAVEGMMGQVQNALTKLQQAHGIFVGLREAKSQAGVLQEIGTIYFDARDYPRTLKYDAQAVEAYAGDPAFTVVVYNNSGETLKEMGRFAEAIAFYQKALKLARTIEGGSLEARILTNLASAHVKSGNPRLAGAVADRGLAVAAAVNSPEWEPFLWSTKAQAALAQGRLVEARGFIERTFAGVDLAETTTPFREAHEIAWTIYSRQGDPAAALAHLTAFKRLDDDLREIAVSTNAGLMTARFDFANQELSIANLKAGQLRRDVALERSKARLNKITLYGLGAALVLAALVGAGALFGFFSVRRSRNEVASANETLSGVNAELETALAAKTRFLATTSHEIRTPLNGILGMTQVMLHDRDLGDVQRDRVRIVHDAGETMKALVDDILDVAKIETGRIVIDSADFGLRDMLSGVARLWTGQAAGKGLVLAVDVDACPERVLGDERRLRQIVFNLLSNAIKFTETGSVALTARAADDVLTLSVRDTGIGIPADQFEAVFTSFHQVDGATTRRYGGTGLGLSICNDLVRAMGGTVSLESELGAGSTFTVRLPVELPAAAVAATRDTAWPDSLGLARLLVVEDNPLARSIIAASLGAEVGEVVAVGSAEAAGVAAQGRFHHAIVDCGALGRIEDSACFIGSIAGAGGAGGVGGTVTLIASVQPDAETYSAYVRAGVTQLLQRPIAPADLAAALRQAHDGWAASEPVPARAFLTEPADARVAA